MQRKHKTVKERKKFIIFFRAKMLYTSIMNYFVLLQQIFILFFVAAMGFIGAKCRILPEEGRKCISKLVLYITLPAMILASVKDVPAGFAVSDLLFIIFLSLLSYGIMGILAYFAPKLLRVPKAEYGVYEFLVLFGNVGFMGFPVLTAVFGSEIIFTVAIFNLPMNIICFTIGVLMIAPKGTKLNLRSLLTPAVISSVIAPLLYLFHITLPDVVNEAFSTIGDTTVPLAMMTIGASIARLPFRDIWNNLKLYLVSAIRLLVCPIVIFFLFRLFISDPVLLGTSVLLAGMPAAANTTLFCIEYGGDEALASRAVCLTTILSAFTIPLLIFLFL